MDYLDTIQGSSTLHIKCDKRLHIGMKVEAMKVGKSMNQFIVDLMEAALTGKARVKHLEKELGRVETKMVDQLVATPIIPQPTPVATEARATATTLPVRYATDSIKQAVEPGLKLCKNGHPIPAGCSRCMGKGCRYS